MSERTTTPDERATERLHLLGADQTAVRAWLAAAEQPAYRADQLLDWIYAKHAGRFDEMTNLSKGLRAWLDEHAEIARGRVSADTVARDGTRKLLLTWPDNQAVETVWIPEPDRHTACVSSQVGCPVGCAFCASGLGGLQRNLTAGEIVEQAWRIRGLIERGGGASAVAVAEATTRQDVGVSGRADVEAPGRADVGMTGRAAPGTPGFAEAGAIGPAGARAPGSAAEQLSDVSAVPPARFSGMPAGPPARLTNVVLMGMGEPLANYDNVLQAIRIINAPWGLGIGARKITLSTVGLPKQIRRLAGEGLQINLALSLHAPTEELRRELIPWGKVPLPELLDACEYYFKQTGREITLEYILLDGVNMEPQHAARLAALAKRLRCNVNLLRYNPVPGLPFRRPSSEAAHAFQRALRERGLNAHIRTSRGGDVDAACGQLRRRTGEAEPVTAAQGEVRPPAQGAAVTAAQDDALPPAHSGEPPPA
jgi:23S rRNA (adenine2503-C2)-methyltransferase